MKQLDKLQPGEKGIVRRVLGNKNVSQRLMAMNLRPGVEIEVIRVAPLGDPIKIQLSHSKLSIRKEDAANIHLSIHQT